MRFTPGTRVGVYEIQDAIGVGGMGEVYRARDTQLGRDVAIKVLSGSFTSDPERLARFEREARTLASLNHPGIGAIYGLEQASVGLGQAVVPALILELVEGETLADRLRRAPLSIDAALGIARQITDALDVAHERGIVHRDLKPANIKITPDEVVKVLDFGLAKGAGLEATLESDPAHSTVATPATREGVILGTPAYMSPEQARGRNVDKRTDIWAFGCILYEMLTGVRAFDGETFSDTIAAVLAREPDLSRLSPSTPRAVRALLGRCLQKDVKRRLRDIADARLEIEDALAQPATTAASTATDRRRWSWQAMLLPVAIAAGIAIGWLVPRPEQSGAAPTFDRMSPLVATPAHEFGPVISADGKWVAYLSNARGPTDIWVKFIAGGDPVNLTANSDLTIQSLDGIAGLAVSPDGSQIGFQAQAPLQLGAGWVIPAPLGGAARRVLPVGKSGIQWSPDGTRIAYIQTGGALGDTLMAADADGQNEVTLVPRKGARHVHWARWDPSGTFLYFNHGLQNSNTETTEIFRVPVSGGPTERVVATARRALFPFPTPDGKGLLYAANPDSVDLSLWWKDFSNAREYRVTTGIGEYGSPSLSADGQRMVGTVTQMRQSLERVAVAFDRPVKLEPLTQGFSQDLDPASSPDGTRLVFSSSRSGNRLLWTARGDLTQGTPLTSGNAFDEHPVYSPDGSQIAFVSDRGGRRGLWIVGAEGGAPRLIAAADVIDTISWSHDGRRLVYSTPIGDAPGLMMMDVATGQTARMPTAAAATAPAWSPREDLIAYIEPRGGGVGSFIKLVRSNGEAVPDRGAVPETQQFGNGMLTWSPDGVRLAAVSLPGGFVGSIWIIEPDASQPFRKLVDLSVGDLIRGVTWSRDGSSLIVGRIQRTADIFFAERSPRP